MKTNAMRILFTLALVGILAIFTVGQEKKVLDVQGQTQPGELLIESVKYEDMLDFLFEEYFVGWRSGYVIRIRYTPERGNELQFSIMETDDGRTEVRVFMPVKESVKEQFYNYVELHPKASFQEIASKMQVKKVSLSFSVAEVRRLRDEILNVAGRSIKFEKDTPPRSNSGETTIFLHPDAYEIRFYGRAHVNLYGESPSDSPEPPFISWMKKKRTLFEKWAK